MLPTESGICLSQGAYGHEHPTEANTTALAELTPFFAYRNEPASSEAAAGRIDGSTRRMPSCNPAIAIRRLIGRILPSEGVHLLGASG